MKTEEIGKQIRAWGASLVGFGDLADFVLPELKHLRFAVSVAVCMPQSITHA